MKNTFKISFFLKRSSVKKNGKAPVIARITVNGEKSELSTHLEINPSNWSVNYGLAIGKEAKEINDNLDHIRLSIQKHYRELLEGKEIVTVEKLKRLYTQLSQEPKTLLQLFKKHNDDAFLMIGCGIVKSTYNKFELAYKRVKDFLDYKYSKQDIFLENLNLTFINDYEIYLRSKCKLGLNTTAKMLQILKKTVTLARNSGSIKTSPFAYHKNKWKKVDLGYLTMQELNSIINKKITIKRLDAVRDVFIFACFSGLSYIDIKNLTIDNIQPLYNDTLWIFTKRQKTENILTIPLLKIPLQIIEKYNGERKDHQLLPVLSNQKMNSYLKELADICDIKKNLTFHMGRHTFSTTIMLDNDVSIESLSKVLGHSNIKTTQIYARITKTKIFNEMSVLDEKLNY